MSLQVSNRCMGRQSNRMAFSSISRCLSSPHLIKSPRVFSNEAMENYKSLEAYKVFVSGWVQTVKHMVLPTGVVILKAEVRPSYKTRNQPHQPGVAINKRVSIVIGHCICMAG